MKLFFLLFLSSPLFADPKGWSSITDQQRKTCDIESHCFIEQRKDNLKFQIFFEVNKKNKMFWLKKVTIAETNSKKTKSYNKLNNFQGIFPGERYKFFALDLNGDNYLDLALKASRSLKAGYFYWVYHPKKKEFVLTKNQLPELIKESNGKIRSVFNDDFYRITKRYTLKKIKKFSSHPQ